jgi:uncharacterized membrane protein (UPF0182 family)
VTDEAGQPTGEQRAARIAPYYQLLQLPQTEGGDLASDAEMVLMRPFVPFSENDDSQLLAAFMAARMDGDNYGDLMVYEMPRRSLPDGPGIAAATIGADETVSELESLLGRGGSEVRYGNMLLVPIDNALLYVQPFYVVSEAQTRQLPQLQRVIAVFGDDVVIEDTLAEALTSLFGVSVETQEQPDQEGGTGEGEGQGEGQGEGEGEATGTATERAAVLLAEADALFAQADEALANQDIGDYQDLTNEARDKVNQAIDLLRSGEATVGGDGSGGDADTETSDSTTTTEPEGGTAAAAPTGPIALRPLTPYPVTRE